MVTTLAIIIIRIIAIYVVIASLGHNTVSQVSTDIFFIDGLYRNTLPTPSFQLLTRRVNNS